MPLYQKPHLTYQEQIELLTSRGLAVPDPRRATDVLATLGYYRLAAYFHTFRTPSDQPDQWQSVRTDVFQPGYAFDHAVALWEFDRRLRSLVFSGIESIEVAMRTRIAHEAGRAGPFAYLSPDYVDPKSLLVTQDGGRAWVTPLQN